MDPVNLLGCVGEVAHSSLDVRERLRWILHFLAAELSFEICIFYSLDTSGKTLSPEHSNLGRGFVAESGSFSVAEGIVGVCAQDMRPLCVGKGDQKNHVSDQWRADFGKYQTLVAIPVADDETLVGVLLMLETESKEIDRDELMVFSIVGREIAGLLRSARLKTDLEIRVRELTALSEVSRVAGSKAELYPLLDMILKTAVRVMGGSGGALRVLDEETDTYKVTSVVGRSPYAEHCLKAGSDSECVVVRSGGPLLFSDHDQPRNCHIPLEFAIPSSICVPLKDEGRTIGVLSVYGKETDAPPGRRTTFREDDIRLLQAMAGHISNALSRAIHHQKIESLVAEKESMVRELSILHATSSAMMKTISVSRLMRVMLMTITLEDGLAFNRAMLFLVDEQKGELEGKIGIGPKDGDEAMGIWESMRKEKRSLSQWLDWALEQPRWIGEENHVNRLAKRIRIPLDERRCVLVQAYFDRKPVRRSLSEPLYGLEKMKPLELGEQFACVPVMARGEPLGVILVDNIFSSRPITDEQLQFLSTFASHAGLALQNAMLYANLKRANEELQSVQQQLLHSERLATLGEFSASMAHEIRNPLVSIGGYARLLQKKHKDEYSKIIQEEVTRLEGILNHILSFSKAATPVEREEVDVNALLDEILRTLREEIRLKRVKIQKEQSSALPEVYCDRGQIKQVFMNLIQNGLDAMDGEGSLGIRTHTASDVEGIWAVVEISDTGGGIAPGVIQNIFNPFFTTKERGTGLGLAIIERFVEAHNGKIEVESYPEKGTTFRVRLPASL